jgi:hypothetical protein
MAQKQDSITIAIDTINIYGRVVDELDKPIKDAIVLSETLNKDYTYISAKTNKEGYFMLLGIKPYDRLRIRTKTKAIEYNLNSSRYLLIKMLPMQKLELNAEKNNFTVEAKRTSNKEKYSYKTKDTILDFGRHPFGYYSSATYPGGLQKFYNQVKQEIVYPDKAIKSNIEGLVIVEFTIDIHGNYQDFQVIRDIGYGCAQEVLRVIKSSKKWNAAQYGDMVNQRVSLEVPFKLTD